MLVFGSIITYQVITGNYSYLGVRAGEKGIITYQVITGNYSKYRNEVGKLNYNIPSNNRELQRIVFTYTVAYDYNIPSNNRELQLITR